MRVKSECGIVCEKSFDRLEKAFFAQVIAALSLSMFTERLSFEIESNSHSFIY
jgi:hypothetical protein